MTEKALRENTLNELKGRLFEYLLGENLAITHGLQKNFGQNVPRKLLDDLKSAADILSMSSPSIVKQLPLLAKDTANFLNLRIPGLKNIYLVGHLAKEKDIDEEDLILLTQKGKIPLSLKLCKQGSYVNTKNAGLMSFVESYFQKFSRARMEQLLFNESYTKIFEDLMQELFEEVGLPFETEVKNWPLSFLPGELPEKLRKKVHNYYHILAEKLHECLTRLELESPELFQKCCSSLLGLSKKEMVQLCCYHGGTLDHEWKGHSLHSLPKDSGKIYPPHKTSSFEIHYEDRILQIRIKPMNRFTGTPKVNCSVKYLYK